MKFAIGALSLLLAAAVDAKPFTKAADAAAASSEQASAMMLVKDDPMETEITVSSEPFFQPRDKGLFGALVEDSYLRGRIKRDGGKVIYEVIYWEEHPRDWYMWDHGTVAGRSGPVDVDGYDAGHDVSCGSYGCNFTEYVALVIPEEIVRYAATLPTWTVRAKGRYGDTDRDISFSQNEVAGFLMQIDRLKQRAAP